MNKKVLSVILLVSLLFSLTGFQSTNSSIQIGNVYYSSGSVNVYFTDRSGVINGTQATVEVEGSPLVNVSFAPLSQKTDVPITVLFLVDTKKNNFNTERERARKVIEKFMDQNDLGQTRTKTLFVMEFGDTISSAYDPRTNAKAIEYTANKADYRDALQQGRNFLLDRQKQNIDEFQVIILITDGERPVDERVQGATLKAELQSAGVPVYVYLRNDQSSGVKQENQDPVKEIADYTNGMMLRGREFTSLGDDKAAERFIEDILKGWALTGNFDPEFRGLNVNPEDSYNLKFKFESSGSTVKETTKANTSIVGVYDEVTTINSEIAAATAAAETAMADASAAADAMATAQAEADAAAEAERIAALETQTAIEQMSAAETEIAAAATATQQAFVEAEAARNPIEKFWNGTTNLYGTDVSNKLFVLLGVLVLGLIIWLIAADRAKKKKAREEELAWELDSQDLTAPIGEDFGGFEEPAAPPKASCQVSFENMDKSRHEGPVRESVETGGEKIFGRRNADGVVGLNGDDSISKVHFKLSYMNGTMYIEDMASSNGVILNGNRIQTRARLQDRDILLIGRSTFRVHLNKSAAAAAPSYGDEDKTQLYF